MQPGTQLGHYEILSPLGKGGMGEVWRAKDTKLGREVAIKTLPEEFAKDEERLARFEREAKLLASLNHPNIATIHGLEEDDGTRFLVLELVEGDTLADRLKRGAIPVEESLKLALQIAEALEAAHEKGVIHRDLKPANVKVTPEGKIKVLDFGLAKALAGDGTDANLSQSPTLSMAATQQGIILGTAAYMSPEQAKGRAVDKRTDIFAFGCVLYEMLTGRQSFGAFDVSESLAAVIRSEPPWDALPENLHPRLREVVERCLEKQIPKRFQDIGDVKVDIENVLADPSGVLVKPNAEVAGAKPQSKLPWAVAVLGVLVAAGTAWNVRPPQPDEPIPITRFAHVLGDGQRLTRTGNQLLAIAPDGSRVVYVANSQLYLRARDTLEAFPVPGTDEDPIDPFFSPDGQWIGYWSFEDRQLKKIPIGGGAPVILTDALNPGGRPSWGNDNTIVFGQPEGIMRVSADGGAAEVLVGGSSLRDPQMLPGEAILYGRGGPLLGEVVVQPLESGEPTVLFPGTQPSYVPTGHLIYGLENALFAVPFDAETLDVTGGQVSVVDLSRINEMQYSVSDSGTLAYIQGGGTGRNNSMVWVDRQGGEETLVPANADGRRPIPLGTYWDPKVSPDGRQVVVADQKDGNDVWVYDLDRATLARLTFDEVEDHTPVWSPDGRWVAYASAKGSEFQRTVYRKRSDGTGAEESLWESNDHAHVTGWTPDGNALLLGISSGAGQLGDIWLLTLDDEPTASPFIQTPFNETLAHLSPDGQWLAYVSDESGRPEIFAQPFPDLDGKWQVSNGGGTQPVWSRSGRELFYRGEGYLMAVDIPRDSTVRPSVPRRLFQDEYVSRDAVGHIYYDIASDDERFLIVRQDGSDASPSQINVILSWFEELKERVPVP